MGVFNAASTIIGIIAPAVNYGNLAASMFGGSFIIGGIIGSFVFAVLLNKYKKFKLLLIIICLGSFIFTGL